MVQFSQTLKSWREARRFSQLQLAMEAEVSSRHISFLETGRARPSAEMIGRLGDALQLPLAARNQMLTQAGFAVRFPGRDWDAEDMAPVRRAIDHTLSAHDPFPALAIDRLWRIVRLNRAAERLYGMLSVGEGDSLLDLLQSDILPRKVENWPEVAHHAAHRLRTESIAQGGIEDLDQAAALLAQVPGQRSEPASPVIPTIFRAGPLRLSLFATIAQFGTPEDLTLDDLKIEMFFPLDDETEAALRAMA